MKVVRLILKLVAVMLSVTAVACAVIAYWDRIVDFFYGIQDKIEERKAARCFCSSEFDDYDDMDE